MEAVLDDEASAIENLILIPLNICCLFTVSYLDNPLMKNPAKFVIIPSALLFTIHFLELAGDEPNYLYLAIGVCTVTALFLVLELAKVNQNVLLIIYELISVFAAIGWISIFSNLIIDFITFLSFYFNINKVILAALLLSAGNTIGDFFGNAALAKNGE